ncbi:MAG: DNA recombination protein RmuC [Actinobacteria bacterium]|uniref:DNA recombination protein RmuC homolog n=1 Tax=Candidatus Fonsibacter lacus TaxID=2576439 RepID=A0A965GBY2_9PROT|nr:DNA recombination protein RmuC [Candidatus Fonsibacter lacus]
MNLTPVIELTIGVVIGLALGVTITYLLMRRESEHYRSQLHAQSEASGASREASARLDELLRSVNLSMAQLTEKTQSAEIKRAEVEAQIKEQIKNMSEKNERLVLETAKLAGALSKAQSRGQMGEAQLELILESSGLIEGVNYERQEHRVNDGEISKPDITIKMPGGTEIFVDSKFPFDRFWDGIGADDSSERSAHMAAHAKDLLNHINALSKRGYQSTSNSPDFVVLFAPFESILHEALDADPLLLQKSFAKSVVIATPTTMLALLRTIAYGYSRHDLARNADEIRSLAGELLKRVGKVHERIENLGERIKGAERAFNELVASAENHLLVPARKMGKLGAPSSKELASPTAIENEIRAIRSIDVSESSNDDELDFMQGEDK